jgi:hypothetical protein
MRLPAGYTSITRWDETTFGILNPSTGEVILADSRHTVPPVPRVRIKRETHQNRQIPEVYPDQIVRLENGKLVWMSHDGEFSIHAPDGRQIFRFFVRDGFPFEFRMDANANIEVFVQDAFKHTQTVQTYSLAGQLLSSRDPWIPMVGRNLDLSRSLLLEHGLEVSTNFPYLRTTGATPRSSDLLHCSGFPPDYREELYYGFQSSGMPPPFGHRYMAKKSNAPFAVSGSTNARDAFVLINGGLVARLDMASFQCTCWSLPVTASDFLPTALASSDQYLATLELLPGEVPTRRVVVRIWKL